MTRPQRMNKIEIRKLIRQQRSQLSPGEIETLSHKMLSQFSLLDLSGISTIHIFLPIAEKKEPDTFIFINWINSLHPDIKILVPRADFDTSLMESIVYQGQELLQKNQFNILEPQKGILHDGEVDLVVIPMLAFDKEGYRVGYGKGFYDRFLQNITTKKVGLCFFEPVLKIDDVNEHDIKLDMCITPLATYRF